MKAKPLKVIVSGGGTGGHIFPALSIANAIQRRHAASEILFVGANHRMEMDKVPEAGYKIIGLPIAGLQRSLSPQNLLFLPRLIASVAKCRNIIKTFNPDVVVGVGGYASGPLLWVAQRMGIKTIIQEQNSYAGLTNKLLASRAKKICVAYDNMEKYFPASKIVITGNPVRKDVQSLDGKTEEAIEYFNLKPGVKTLLVVGGSLGARTINESIVANLDELIRKKIQVIWQTGRGYYEQAKAEVANYNDHHIHVFQFISRMDLAYTAADFVISRAGAGTISELCIVGKPVILVPSPNVAEDHQTKNAKALANQNAAILIKDSEAPGKLVSELIKLASNDTRQIELGINIHKMAKPYADEEIVNEIDKLIE